MHLDLSEGTPDHYNQALDTRLRKFRPNPDAEKKLANDILEGIRNELQRDVHPFQHADFQTAGSLKKDTMLTERKEIDIIISLPQDVEDYPPSENTRQELLYLLADYYDVERRNEGNLNLIIHQSDYKVDLLPTFKIDHSDFLNLSEEDKYIFKPHMSLLHIEFILDHDKKFQDFCRIIKYWAHGPSIQERDKFTSSFFLEIICSEIWRISTDWSYLQLFEAFLRRMKNILRRNKGVAKFFGSTKYYDCMEIRGDGLHKLTVLDPVDPDDNLYDKGPQNERLPELRTRARKTLKLWGEKNFQAVFENYFSKDPT